MWKPIEFMYDAISEDLGRPMTLLRMIDEHPDMRVQVAEPEPVIAADRVAQWHNWGDQSSGHWPRRKHCTILGWRHSAGNYSSFELHRPELENFGRCEVLDMWNCDIQDVTGLSFSKSELHKFTSLDSMVETNSREMIDAITEEKLHENLAHDGMRILNREGTSDYFARYLWDGRIFLINDGGSHHFAAARYIASRIKRPVPLLGKLLTYSINPQAVNALRRDFDVYAMSDDAAITNGFFDSMRMFRATFLWQYLPRPYDHARAIFLPKNEPRSMRVSSALREAGMFDIGEHLTKLTNRQIAARATPIGSHL